MGILQVTIDALFAKEPQQNVQEKVAIEHQHLLSTIATEQMSLEVGCVINAIEVLEPSMTVLSN